MGQNNISLCRQIGGLILVCRVLKSLRTTALNGNKLAKILNNGRHMATPRAP